MDDIETHNKSLLRKAKKYNRLFPNDKIIEWKKYEDYKNKRRKEKYLNYFPDDFKDINNININKSYIDYDWNKYESKKLELNKKRYRDKFPNDKDNFNWEKYYSWKSYVDGNEKYEITIVTNQDKKQEIVIIDEDNKRLLKQNNKKNKHEKKKIKHNESLNKNDELDNNNNEILNKNHNEIHIKNDIGKKHNDEKETDFEHFINDEEDKEPLNFHKLNNTNSYITCRGRPKVRNLALYKDNHKINYILSILNPKEKPEEIRDECLRLGIDWVNLNLKGAKVGNLESNVDMIADSLINTYNHLLKNDTVLLIHCAAGLHRTGVSTYCLIRMNGENQENAMEILGKIRLKTKQEVGEKRIEFVEKCLLPKVLEKMKKLG